MSSSLTDNLDHGREPGRRYPASLPGASRPATIEAWPGLRPAGPLLLVESEAHARTRLQRRLVASRFEVSAVDGMRAALAAAAETRFAYALVELRLGDGNGLELIRRLREQDSALRIVVVTDSGSFATVILALRAGAVDYLPKPVEEGELMDALFGRTPLLPPIPETPLRVERLRWEHIQRIYEQCGRNVSETARRLGMHRRSLQRILAKRAPNPRGPQL